MRRLLGLRAAVMPPSPRAALTALPRSGGIAWPPALCVARPLASSAAASRGRANPRALFSELKQIRCRRRLAEIEAQLPPLRGAKEWNQLIGAHAKVGLGKRALGMLDEMREAGVAPDVYSYSRAISICEKSGEWQRALSLLDEMRGEGVAPNVINYNASISACGRGGQWERAVSLLGEMREAGVTPTTISYNTAISACAR